MFSSDSCFSCQSRVSRVGERFCYLMGDMCPFLARILVRRGRLEDAKRVLGRVYVYATPEQVDLKVMHCPHRGGVMR